VQPGVSNCPNCGKPLPSVADYPTLELPISSQRNSSADLEATQPYPLLDDPADTEVTQPNLARQGPSQNLGFSVITRTDPGIKRRHKPNEDSLFAAQFTRPVNSSFQQVGLFVVADGVGGHANGQDASRSAIQTIVNHILPSLAHKDQPSREAFRQLLIEGVQQANLAVHQRNLEQQADMGTTMTAALVIEPLGVTYNEDDTRPPSATAYIANVGDSRTYLYRPKRGLMKLTNDHSVVASLVEAGVIQPDDIYTHPKRNQIYRSLGEKSVVEVDTFVVPVEIDDKLLLCSDGLWEMVRDPQIEAVLRQPLPDPNMTGETLLQAALHGGGEDNISLIVVQIPDPSKLNASPSFQLIDKPETMQMPGIILKKQ
jgi:serine/threonine protein phosphatase PrpC